MSIATRDIYTADPAAVERARQRARALAEQQGVKPIRSIDDLRGDFWPEEEGTAEFLAWLRSTRQEGSQRSLPE